MKLTLSKGCLFRAGYYIWLTAKFSTPLQDAAVSLQQTRPNSEEHVSTCICQA